MHSWDKKRAFSRLNALAFIGLAFCIFMWGLQYKLSQYDPAGAASHRIPMAKLLSRNELSSSSVSPTVIRTRTSTRVFYAAPGAVFLLLFILVSVSNELLPGQREQRASQLWHIRRAHLRTSFVRPPPVLV